MFEKTRPEGWERYYSQCLVGASLAGQKKYAEAEPMLLAGYAGMAARQTSIPRADRAGLEETGRWILRLYNDWKKPDRAAEWRLRLANANVAVSSRY